MDIDGVMSELLQGVEEVLPSQDALRARLLEGKPLRVKLGVDPTAPDIHLGHTVVLNKLRQFQDCGHEVVFLVGDFTAMIGDPTGKSATRKLLSAEDVAENAQSYRDQVFKILDESKTRFAFNAEWLGLLSAADMIQLAASHTVARMMERDDFKKRFKSGQSIAIHEFLYPLLQGYDSVAMQADVEIGGTDQTFNLLVGRELQRQKSQTQQIVLTMPLLEGTDGVQKMSKSLGNSIGITDQPADMFGKLMSISDELMWRYFDLVSGCSVQAVAQHKDDVAAGKNPRDIKVELATVVVTRFHGAEAAAQAYESFVAQFKRGEIPEDLETIEISADGAEVGLPQLLKQAGLVKSTSEGMRMLKQGAVKVDGARVEDVKKTIANGFSGVLQVGRRRFAKVELFRGKRAKKIS